MPKYQDIIANFAKAIGADKIPRKINAKNLEFLDESSRKETIRILERLEQKGETIRLSPKLSRPNYFGLEGRYLIIKISRSDRPFWGVGKRPSTFLITRMWTTTSFCWSLTARAGFSPRRKSWRTSKDRSGGCVRRTTNTRSMYNCHLAIGSRVRKSFAKRSALMSANYQGEVSESLNNKKA